jgi:hypothetical protein
MTKIQARFRIVAPLDTPKLERLAALHSVYGIMRVCPEVRGNSITVEYDGTRLGLAEVEAALERAGVAVLQN